MPAVPVKLCSQVHLTNHHPVWAAPATAQLLPLACSAPCCCPAHAVLRCGADASVSAGHELREDEQQADQKRLLLERFQEEVR